MVIALGLVLETIYGIIEETLTGLGAELNDVLKVTIIVVDIGRREEVAQAHNELLPDQAPATAAIEVRALVDPEMMVEIEARAILPQLVS